MSGKYYNLVEIYNGFIFPIFWMEQQLRQPKRMERVIGKMKPSADRMGDVLGLMEPDQLRQMLPRMNRQLGRNKALRNDWPLRR